MPEPEQSDSKIVLQPINDQPSGLDIPKKRSKRKIFLVIFGVLIFLFAILAAGGYCWYDHELKPVGSDIHQLKLIKISAGSTPSQIGKQLQGQSIIKNSLAFEIYARVSKKSNSLQAGTYRLSPAETTQQIVEHIVNGAVDEFSITFFPGATLTDDVTKSESKKFDVTTVLKKAGYSSKEIKVALSDRYDSPLFDSKPASADLEGYIYGNTYEFGTGTTVHDILTRVFDEFYAKVKENKLIEAYSSHGLNLYQGITLASIIQREVNTPQDQKQVAQIFYTRLKTDMVLGSDVTYQYIADKTGVTRDVNIDSPYNTRRNKGLPPGPISAPGLTALVAVAQPKEGDYVYFLSGDDDITYFAKTYEEHEANIANHCKIKCTIQ